MPVGIRVACCLFLVGVAAHANVTLLLEEPHGSFGRMVPVGHAAIYLSRICAETTTRLRRCHDDEKGVVLGRYHHVSSSDWLAVPLLPYLYAVDTPEEVPLTADAEDVARLRDSWRRRHLQGISPDGDWAQLVGAAYERTLFAFEAATTEEQDDRFIETFNTAPNENHYSLLFNNCADFARRVINFYYPGSVRRSVIADVGIMSPKQAAKSFLKYARKHAVPVPAFIIPQVAGSIRRSKSVRGVLEALIKSKKYAFPLVSLAALHPFFTGSIAIGWIQGGSFDPRRAAEGGGDSPTPARIAVELQGDLSVIDPE